MIGAEVAILGAIAQHVVGSGKHGCCDGEDGFFRTPPGFDAKELGPQVGAFHGYGGPVGRDQGGFEPGAAFSGPSYCLHAVAFAEVGRSPKTAVVAAFAAGASAAYLTDSLPSNIVTALKADEGVPHNLVTA